MTTRFWVKLYIEILDDPKMGRLPDDVWRFAVECFLLAGKEGDDGVLPCVEDIAWTLRLPEEKVLEYLGALAEVEMVQEGEGGKWYVSNFEKRQVSESAERVRRYRARYSNGECNGEVTAAPSTSTSVSESDSDSSEEEGVQGEGKPRLEPRSPVEAMQHPDIRVFGAATGGRIPGAGQYGAVIEAMRYLREKKRLDDKALGEFLGPYWQAWSTRRRVDGRPYDPGNITWLTEWALNESIPPVTQNGGGQERKGVIREVARRKK